MHPFLSRLSPPTRAAAVRSLTTGRGALSRRSLLRGTAATGLLAATGTFATACSDSGGGSDADVVFSNWPLYIDVDDKDKSKHPTLEAFTQQTGLKVKYTEDINDNNEFFAKIQPQLAKGKDTKRDLIVLTNWLAAKMVRLGYVQKYNPANVPNAARNLDARFRGNSWDPQREFAYPWAELSTLIAYNAKATDGFRPTSVEDLLTNEKLKGKVALLTEMRDTIGMVLLAMGKSPEKFTDDDFNAAIDKVQKAVDKQQIRRFTGNDYAQELGSGDIAACLAWSGDLVQIKAEHPEVEFVIPDHGYASSTDELLLPIKAQHKDNAEKLVDFYYQPPVAAQLVASINYISPVSGIRDELLKISPDMANNPLVLPTPEVTAKGHAFRALTEDEETRYEAAFAKLTGA
ncbi:ABC transporter substrate-binding protein [Uniformispora flossi]|uniref:ABC transporter substrate-binding protein n=1 Tax=Uniformispora flossi TaxID=3390723 RepID=UPI003C2F6928